MYAVINLDDVPQAPDRDRGEQLLEALQRDNSQARWALVIAVSDPNNSPVQDLEYLYGLTSILLQNSGLNPFALELTVANLDGSETKLNAVTVMNRAREWLDQIGEAH